MPPFRTRDDSANDKKGQKSSEKKRHRYHKKSNPDEPGIQKLKASLRQTQRLLAKDNLAPDVQIQAERKLKSLEADLAKAEIRKRERAMAVRYHKIKFFDKQKVTRKLRQTKRALEAPGLDKKERKKLQKELLKHRVDLNYIIHYPKLDKYISLYPSSSNDSGTSESDKLREERRAAIRQAMENGEMDVEPEMNQSREETHESEVEAETEGDEQEYSEEEPEEFTPKSHRPSKLKHEESKKLDKKAPRSGFSSAPTQKPINIQEDDFFDT